MVGNSPLYVFSVFFFLFFLEDHHVGQIIYVQIDHLLVDLNQQHLDHLQIDRSYPTGVRC